MLVLGVLTSHQSRLSGTISCGVVGAIGLIYALLVLRGGVRGHSFRPRLLSTCSTSTRARGFAANVARVLAPDGIWLSLIGSTEGPPQTGCTAPQRVRGHRWR